MPVGRERDSLPPLRMAFSYSKSAPRLDAAFESSVDILAAVAFAFCGVIGFRTIFSANMSRIIPWVVSALGGVAAVDIDVELICRELFRLLIDALPGPSCGRRKRPLLRPSCRFGSRFCSGCSC